MSMLSQTQAMENNQLRRMVHQLLRTPHEPETAFTVSQNPSGNSWSINFVLFAAVHEPERFAM